MQFSWLVKNNLKRLIVFFNGWSLDEEIIGHLCSSKYDILMFYNYESLDIQESIFNELNNYDEINIISWSFGVWACSAVIEKFANLKNTIAINGTLLPIDNEKGIPERIFSLTLSTLSEKNYLKFFKNMFSNFTDADNEKLSSRDLESKKNELSQIKTLSLENKYLNNMEFFSKVIIGRKDRIIPSKNQIKFWTENNFCKIIEVEQGHYIFDMFNTWDEILDYE